MPVASGRHPADRSIHQWISTGRCRRIEERVEHHCQIAPIWTQSYRSTEKKGRIQSLQRS